MNYIGGIEDPRPVEAKAKDWSSEEILGKGIFDWNEGMDTAHLIGTERNQNGSYECGAFSGVQALGRNNYFETNKFIDLLPNFIYQKRQNKNTDGMYLQDLLSLMCSVGAPEDKGLSNDNKHKNELDQEVFTDAQIKDALNYKGLNYVTLSRDVDSIAYAIHQGYTPIVLISCDLQDWLDEPVVTNSTVKDFGHFVPMVYPQLIKGKKGIWFNDSFKWSKGKNGFKWMSEDFIKAHVVACGYVIDLKSDNTKPKPYPFNAPITYGQSNEDVIALQKILVYRKFMVAPKSYGYFGNLTARAVQKYQISKGINDFANETDITKIRVGQKTITQLNKEV